MKKKRIHRILIIVLITLFYGNTLTLNYALDDRMVILESKYTIAGGWNAVKSIFTQDTFSGYFGNERTTVAGGRYRPMSQLSFMIECQLFGKKIKEQIGDVDDYYNLHNAENTKYFEHTLLPVVSHFMNVLYFILLCLLIYEVLSRIFQQYEGAKWIESLPFLTVVLFALHPIHTEVVANIKGRDEIFAMLGATGSLIFALCYVDKRKIGFLLLSFISFLFGIFSKENAVTYLAIIPLTLFFYDINHKKKQDYIVTLLPVLLATIFFVWVRSGVLGGLMPKDETFNVLNNPFIHSTRMQEIATVLLTWGIYFKLLLFPHPLTHDYYPNEIEIVNFSNLWVWLVLVGCAVMVCYALKKLKARSVISYAVLFFFITFSITSNLLFNIGTFMNERFVFIPSLGFALACAYGLYVMMRTKKEKLWKPAVALLVIVSSLYGGKTFARNFAWKDDATLFLTDVKTSSNSIKCNISAGGTMLQIWKKSHKERDKIAAYNYLENALRLDKHAINAHLLLGELLFLDGNVDGAYQAYKNATIIDPNYPLAIDNLKKMALAKEEVKLKSITELLEAAMAEQNEGKVMQALAEIDRYIQENPESLVAKNIKGNILGRGLGRLDDSIKMYEEVLAKDATFVSAWENMGIAYAIKKDFDKAETFFMKALELSPENENIKHNIRSMQQEKDHARR